MEANDKSFLKHLFSKLQRSISVFSIIAPRDATHEFSTEGVSIGEILYGQILVVKCICSMEERYN